MPSSQYPWAIVWGPTVSDEDGGDTNSANPGFPPLGYTFVSPHGVATAQPNSHSLLHNAGLNLRETPATLRPFLFGPRGEGKSALCFFHTHTRPVPAGAAPSAKFTGAPAGASPCTAALWRLVGVAVTSRLPHSVSQVWTPSCTSPSPSPSSLSWSPPGSYSSSGEWGLGRRRLSPCWCLQAGGQEDCELLSPGVRIWCWRSPREVWHMAMLGSNAGHRGVPRTSLSSRAGAWLPGHFSSHLSSLSKAGTVIRSAGVTRGSRAVGGSRRASSPSRTSPPPPSASWGPTATPWPPRPRRRSPGRARRVWRNWGAMGRARPSSSTGEWPVSWGGRGQQRRGGQAGWGRAKVPVG